ncbi:MAG: hypothetical protein R3Y50_08815 [Rikenellaceae bacterium]
MDAIEIMNYVASLEYRCNSLENELADLRKNTVDLRKYYNTQMSTQEVAKLHAVSENRVRDYAKRGLIELHPNSTDTTFLFRGTTALSLEWKSLRKQKSALKR